MKKKALKITGFAALAGWMFASAAMGALHDETTWAQDLLRERFGIHHSTIQFEPEDFVCEHPTM